MEVTAVIERVGGVAGSVTPAHVDAVTKVAKGLEGAARGKLLKRADGWLL